MNTYYTKDKIETNKKVSRCENNIGLFLKKFQNSFLTFDVIMFPSIRTVKICSCIIFINCPLDCISC